MCANAEPVSPPTPPDMREKRLIPRIRPFSYPPAPESSIIASVFARHTHYFSNGQLWNNCLLKSDAYGHHRGFHRESTATRRAVDAEGNEVDVPMEIAGDGSAVPVEAAMMDFSSRSEEAGSNSLSSSGRVPLGGVPQQQTGLNGTSQQQQMVQQLSGFRSSTNQQQSHTTTNNTTTAQAGSNQRRFQMIHGGFPATNTTTTQPSQVEQSQQHTVTVNQSQKGVSDFYETAFTAASPTSTIKVLPPQQKHPSALGSPVAQQSVVASAATSGIHQVAKARVSLSQPIELPAEMAGVANGDNRQLQWIISVGKESVSEQLSLLTASVGQIAQWTADTTPTQQGGSAIASSVSSLSSTLVEMVTCVKELSALLRTTTQHSLQPTLLQQQNVICEAVERFLKRIHEGESQTLRRSALLSAASQIGDASAMLSVTTASIEDEEEGGAGEEAKELERYFDLLNDRIQQVATSTANLVLQ